MDQSLKQQLVGAAVITALAAIFVPMLFDDTVDEAGKTVSELTIPEVPAKAQEVEILPIPDKAEAVATVEEPPQPTLPQANPNAAPKSVRAEEFVDEGEEMSPTKPQVRLTDRETAVKPVAPTSKPKLEAAAARAQVEDLGEDVDLRPVEAPKPQAGSAQPKPAKPVVAAAKPAQNAPAESASAKPVTPDNASSGAATRWYLNAGSFTQKDNAVALHDNLKKQGFAVSIKETASDKGTIYKVRIGPLLDKAKAQAMKVKLAQINVNSFVAGEE